MPVNKPKQYAFVPVFNEDKDEVNILSYSKKYSRLITGGMFFRSRMPGKIANSISITGTFIDNPVGSLTVIDGTTYGGEYELAVKGELGTNHVIFSGAGSGMLSLLITADEQITKYTLTAVSESQFRLQPDNILISVNELYRTPKFAVKIAPKIDSQYIIGEIFTVINFGATERFVVPNDPPPPPADATAPTTPVDPTAPPPAPPAPTPTIVIPALVLLVNASSNLVKMPIRGVDKSDTGGSDGMVAVAIPKINLNGADGLPVDANGIKTGPDRALIHINYADDEDGNTMLINSILEWSGQDVTNGSWTAYS